MHFNGFAASIAVWSHGLVDHTIKLVFDYKYFSSRDTRLQKEVARWQSSKKHSAKKAAEAVLFEEGGLSDRPKSKPLEKGRQLVERSRVFTRPISAPYLFCRCSQRRDNPRGESCPRCD